MKIVRYWIFSGILFLGHCPLILASNSTSMDFLRIVPSVRGYGLTGNSVALSGAESVGMNPAGLSLMEKSWDAYTTFYHPTEGANYSHLVIAKQFSPQGPAVSAGITHYTIDGGQQRDGQQNFLGGELVNQDIALTFGVAGKETNRWRWGANLRAARAELAGYKSNWSLGGDLGVLVKARGVQLGAYSKNMGTGIKFISETNPLPTEVSLEAGYPFKMVLPVVGYHRDVHRKENALSLAAEGAFGPFRVRGGYRVDSSESGTNAADNLYFGVGGNLAGFTLDYGLSQQANENSYLHRVGISAAWGNLK
jgi:hypothetical protein